jgi:hypothetical protein
MIDAGMIGALPQDFGSTEITDIEETPPSGMGSFCFP